MNYTVKEFPNGNKEWRLNGRLHREDGPAIIFADGRETWYLEGYYHREDGPAVEYSNGDKSWYLHGELVFNERTNNTDKFDISKEMKLSIIKYKLTL